MGATIDEEEPHPPAKNEESPSLYEEGEGLLGTEIEAPDPKATPDEVRDFLVQVLIARGNGIDHARRVAARWTLGNGRELRSYPTTMYRDIFGVEDGWMVYKAVRVIFYKKELDDLPDRSIAVLLAVICIAVFCGLIVLKSKSNIGPVGNVAAIIGLVIALLGTCIGCTLSSAGRDPEEMAEAELKKEWYKRPAAS